MSNSKKIISSAMFLALFANPSFSLTADEVWEKYDAAARVVPDTKIEFSTKVKTGNTLTVSNFMSTTQVEDLKVSYSIDKIQLIEMNDGSVRWTNSEIIPFFVEGTGKNTNKLSFEVVQENANIKVSGDVENMTIESDVPVLLVRLTEAQDESGPISAKANMTFQNVSSIHSLGNEMQITAKFKAEAIAFDLAFADPEIEESAEFTGILNGADVSVSGNLAALSQLGSQSEPPQDLFANIAYKFDGFQTEANVTTNGEPVSISSSGGTSNVTYELTNETLKAKSEIRDIRVSANTPVLPFPLDFKISEGSGDFAFPLKKDTRGELIYGFDLNQLELGDGIWNLFDAGQVFPRDPLTLSLKLSGDVEPAFDVLANNPEELATLESPGKIYGLDLENLIVKALGASLTGSGSFIFDNTDLETFGGFPKPQGSANFSLLGANALLDKLPDTGLVKTEDLLGIRMMMGMFTQPGDGSDSLKTQIEVNQDGHVLVNGVRMR